MTRPWQLTFGLLLTALAGYIDAIGFIRLSSYYTSFMSGNTTQMGVSMAHGEFGQALMPTVLIIMFLIGSTLGSGLAIVTPAPWKTVAVLAYEAVLIVGTFSLGLHLPDVGLVSLFLALAMGAQNAVLGSVQGFRAGTTFVTGALFSLGQKIAAALTGTGPAFGWIGDATVWLALLLGAFLGAAVYNAMGIFALVFPAALTGLLAVVAGLSVRLRHVDP
ncbi:YoaK family protein [uncultured Methylobacterium sp.]|uniref:YoaK family protein n=1 Tax=uncultured Methylobacterium sp. TaxID=157278 RepID=UPI0035CB3D80